MATCVVQPVLRGEALILLRHAQFIALVDPLEEVEHVAGFHTCSAVRFPGLIQPLRGNGGLA